MSRLIDADKLIDYFYYGEGDKPIIDGIADRKIIEIIREQPTAYDVEKVAAELACNSRFIDNINEHNIKCISCVIGQKTAIDIVRKGGV